MVQVGKQRYFTKFQYFYFSDYRKFVKTLLEGFDGKEIKYEIMEKIANLWLELQQNDK